MNLEHQVARDIVDRDIMNRIDDQEERVEKIVLTVIRHQRR